MEDWPTPHDFDLLERRLQNVQTMFPGDRPGGWRDALEAMGTQIAAARTAVVAVRAYVEHVWADLDRLEDAAAGFWCGSLRGVSRVTRGDVSRQGGPGRADGGVHRPAGKDES